MKKTRPKSNSRKYHSVKFEGDQNSTFEERIVTMRAAGKKAQEEFTVKLQNINRWFTADYDQLYLLSFCLRYFLMKDEGYDEEAETGQLSFPPHYLEIMQALALVHPRVISARPLWSEVESLEGNMQEIGALIKAKLFNLPDSIVSEEQLHAYKVRMDVMLHSLAVRNWAYPQQIFQVTVDMATLVRQKFVDVTGTDPVALVKLLFKLGEIVEMRVNQHIKKLHSALSKKDHIEIQETYSKVFGGVMHSKGDMKRLWKNMGEDLGSLRAMLMAHSDIRLADLFTFSLAELEEACDKLIDKQTLTKLFDRLSFQFGDLRDYDQEHIILSNPVHDRPFIKVEKDSYFSSLWTIIPHLSLSLLESLIAEDENTRRAYNDLRAKYLEDKLEQQCIDSFPDAHVLRGSIWRGDDGKDYENDMLIVQDSFAIVLEAKAGSVTKAAKRGGPDRLFKTIKDLVEAPSEQALRFIDYLKVNKRQCTFKTKGGQKNEVNLSDVTYFIPFGVTFYNLGMIGTNLKLLIDAGITERQIHQLAPSIGITDLQVVFEVLDSAAQKVHYLHRRREFEMQASYLADELDLLGFYLENGFNLGDLDNEPNLMIDLSISSKSLDPYFIQKWVPKLPEVQKPSLSMTDWWRDILQRLEERKPKRWLELAYVLLNMNQSAQEDLEESFRVLVSRIRKGDVELRHNWVTFCTAKEERRFVVIAYPYLDEHRQERDDMIPKILGKALEEQPKAKGYALIAVNIDKDHYPYSMLAGHLSIPLVDDTFTSMSALKEQ